MVTCISCKFRTFDAVVIEPKPQLNVIVGPNGKLMEELSELWKLHFNF